MTQSTTDSGTSPLKGSYSFVSLVKLSSQNLHLFQSYEPVIKIQGTKRL